ASKIEPFIESNYPFIHILFIYLDLASAIRAYLSSEFYFEKQLNLRRINIVIYEGFKHIYGYDEDDKSLSFWKNYILSTFENSQEKHIIESLNIIENGLKELSSDTSINNTILRECTVHYRYKERDNLLALFNELIKLNPIIELNKSFKLLILLPKLMEIITKSVELKGNIEINKMKLSNQKNIEIINNFISMIENSKTEPKTKKDVINTLNKIKNLLASDSTLSYRM
ncbi:MAG: hypothetical protein Q4G63_12980, partial [Bacteroidia bacterium]|nr:hypothetical protein [Bacteroidia bacterium]